MKNVVSPRESWIKNYPLSVFVVEIGGCGKAFITVSIEAEMEMSHI